MTKEKSRKQLVIIGPNHVEVQYVLKDDTGNDVVVEQLTEVYGVDRMQMAMAVQLKELDTWRSMTSEIIADKIAVIEKNISELNEIFALLKQSVLIKEPLYDNEKC